MKKIKERILASFLVVLMVCSVLVFEPMQVKAATIYTVTTEDEFKIIRPVGGGGTDFGVIFDYVRKEMVTPPASIIILTDGYAPFPQKRAAMGIPTLWLINNEDVTPPWGKIARIKV